MKLQIGWISLRSTRDKYGEEPRLDSVIKLNLAIILASENLGMPAAMAEVFVQQKRYLITIEPHCEPESSFKLLSTLKCQNKHSGRAAVCAYFL